MCKNLYFLVVFNILHRLVSWGKTDHCAPPPAQIPQFYSFGPSKIRTYLVFEPPLYLTFLSKDRIILYFCLDIPRGRVIRGYLPLNFEIYTFWGLFWWWWCRGGGGGAIFVFLDGYWIYCPSKSTQIYVTSFSVFHTEVNSD